MDRWCCDDHHRIASCHCKNAFCSGENRVEYIENRFAAQARFTTLITGLSGFYMVYILDAWSRFTELRYWWMHAMVISMATFYAIAIRFGATGIA